MSTDPPGVALEQPLYGATFGQAIQRFRAKLTVFSGRASRSEYWWAYLLMTIISAGAGFVIAAIWIVVLVAQLIPLASDSRPTFAEVTPILVSSLLLYGVIFAVSIVISLSLLPITIRRLHDAGYSGLWTLAYLVPFGGYVVLVLCILGPNPLGARFDQLAPSAG